MSKVVEAPIEVDYSAGDSDYDSGLPSDTTSVASSVYNFTYDNGRRYTQWSGEGKYLQRMSHLFGITSYSNLLPANDETEQNRLDIGHQSFPYPTS